MAGRCSVPMWMAGCPAGSCGEEAFGIYIDGPTFRDAWSGEVRRMDGKFRGYVPDLACPKHGGPEKTGPRVLTDGTDENGRRMHFAFYEDFENLQESPAEFHIYPWVAIEMLLRNHPRTTERTAS